MKLVGSIRGKAKSPRHFVMMLIRLAWTLSDERKQHIVDRGNWCADCRNCMPKQKDLEVHHVIPIGSYDDYSSLDDLYKAVFESEVIVLCKKCHKKRHRKK